MTVFNKELIKNVKIFGNESGEFSEEKYSFIKYVFTKFESIDEDSIEIVEEEFEDLKCNIDALYFDEDSSVYNLYIAAYSDSIDDNAFLSKEEIYSYYDKIINFIKKIIEGKYSCFDESSLTFSIADDIHRLLKETELVVNIVSNYNIPSAYKKDSNEDINGTNVSFRTYDLADLENKFSQITNAVATLNCEEKFAQKIQALRIFNSNDFDVYLFSMKGTWLATLYKEDSVRLLEQNVRSYLKRTAKVNAGILETVKNSPEKFVSFNNGISAVCTGVTSETNSSMAFISKIDNFQIVNGGQTTATLYECLKDKLLSNLNDLQVPVKLTVIKNIGSSDSFIRNISLYSNTQTQIKKSDPPSNLPFYVQIKKLSQSCISNDGNQNYLCYFERTNGEYETELRRNNASKKFINANPKDKKFDKIDLARAINCWEQLPYVTCQGKEKNFALFNDTVKNQLFEPDEAYFKNAYSLVVLYKKLDKIAKKLKLSVKSNVIAHTMSLVSYLYSKELDLNCIWNSKDLPTYLIDLSYDLLPKVHEIIINAPAHCSEPRMWARKESCWNLVKNIDTNLVLHKTGKKIDLFRKNDALIFISNKDNFYNSLTWMKLLLWDNKYRFFGKGQTNIVKFMQNSADKNVLTLTKKQIDFLKETFISAVKHGYKYQ